jgi:four helix bundle protein
MGQIVSFRDLDVWNAGMDLVLATYDICASVPASEEFGLRAQMRRAAVSIPSNIAEGHASGPTGRYRNHVRISLGSLAELDTQLHLAWRLKYIDRGELEVIEQQLTRVRQLLHGVQRSLRRRAAGRLLAFAAWLWVSSAFLFS